MVKKSLEPNMKRIMLIRGMTKAFEKSRKPNLDLLSFFDALILTETWVHRSRLFYGANLET